MAGRRSARTNPHYFTAGVQEFQSILETLRAFNEQQGKSILVRAELGYPKRYMTVYLDTDLIESSVLYPEADFSEVYDNFLLELEAWLNKRYPTKRINIEWGVTDVFLSWGPWRMAGYVKEGKPPLKKVVNLSLPKKRKSPARKATKKSPVRKTRSKPKQRPKGYRSLGWVFTDIPGVIKVWEKGAYAIEHSPSDPRWGYYGNYVLWRGTDLTGETSGKPLGAFRTLAEAKWAGDQLM